MNLYDQITQATEHIQLYSTLVPEFGIILGTGLSGLVDDLLIANEFDYADIPHFARSTVQSHKGKLILGYLNGVPVVVMSGRFHYYEGYTMEQVTFPVRVMKSLGIKKIIITNVSGGLNADFEAGDIVVVNDHINLTGNNPLRGENDERLGVRFLDMLDAYDSKMLDTAFTYAQSKNYRVHKGVYVGLSGPNLETPAEYRFLNIIGADAVGLSSVPEVIVARHAALPVCMLSLISNKCFPIHDITKTSLEDVIETARLAEPRLRDIVKHLVAIK